MLCVQAGKGPSSTVLFAQNCAPTLEGRISYRLFRTTDKQPQLHSRCREILRVPSTQLAILEGLKSQSAL